MAVERHLILQELVLRPSGEWTPQAGGWTVVRVAEGGGYWLHDGTARELNAGDVAVMNANARALFRSSQLGPLKLQFFSVQPQFLNGVLTVSEFHQLEAVSGGPPPGVLIFAATDPVAQKFSRIADRPRGDNLSLRCALLQLWSSALNGLLATPVVESAGSNKLQDRFRQLVGRMTEAELAESSLAELARQLHCSERHFSRVFREEFGVPLRARQTELRLQRAKQLLADSDAKVINVAYESGYRHLGLFNAMFKKRFGVTPSEWRQQNTVKNFSIPPRSNLSRMAPVIGVLLTVLGLFFSLSIEAQTNTTPGDTEAMDNTRAALLQKMAAAAAEEKAAQMQREQEEIFGPVHRIPASTNAGPRFTVNKYLVMGNSVLLPGTVGGILTNVPDAFGTNVTFAGIQAALGDLQMAYRERGYVTVSVGLPPQKLTNAEVKVQVTEARLAAINVVGNRWFSTGNVLRALPSLQTNMLLNSHVLQRELDQANASRDRQIYPVIGPGPDPGTSALTLKVKDTFPLHARTELNNDSTPGTPTLRVNSSAQYDNLWNLNHQIGIQYSFSPEQFKNSDYFSSTPFDDPMVANYSGYYRIPLPGLSSVEQQVEGNPGSFGYNEVTHKFNLPPATGQPDVTFFASRSTDDTGTQLAPVKTIFPSNGNIGGGTNILVLQSQDSGENVTLNEGLGGSFSMPLPQVARVSSTFILGLNYKLYDEVSYNTNNFYSTFTYTNGNQGPTNITSGFHSPQPVRYQDVQYLPLDIGLNGSIPDRFGTTFFNVQANCNLAILDSYTKTVSTVTDTNGVSTTTTTVKHGGFSQLAYSSNARDNYVTVQAGANRDQNLYKEWSVRLHADGQWADTPLFSNEQYGLGGPSGVRGYPSGVVYGDTGWRMTVEPRTPQVSIGMAGNDGDAVPVWVRGLAFVDYGQVYRLASTAGYSINSASLLGVGWGVTANIGSHLDARVTMAWPLMSNEAVPGGSAYVYFAIGAQF
jgi:hemolysin activation/secretion protein/AraC-like DNA-binding protein